MQADQQFVKTVVSWRLRPFPQAFRHILLYQIMMWESVVLNCAILSCRWSTKNTGWIAEVVLFVKQRKWPYILLNYLQTVQLLRACVTQLVEQNLSGNSFQPGYWMVMDLSRTKQPIGMDVNCSQMLHSATQVLLELITFAQCNWHLFCTFLPKQSEISSWMFLLSLSWNSQVDS